jgi:nitroimidazol reductase NimA-like FMN-containing flavoprotein (pyridoxamine 5'-phosphate oxidase superfamily)
MTPTTSSPSRDVPTSEVGTPTRLAPARRSLTRGFCLALLAPGGYGRVAATMKAVPIIIPVSFILVGEDLVLRLGSDEGLSRAVANSVVAFETDHLGSDGRALWGVQVTGVARMVTDGTKEPGFRLSSEIVTGWRCN